jgi:iron complex outermembrane receptor protein
VVTARQLESAGVKEFTDVSRVAPSLTIRQADQPINASVALRGIGAFAYGIEVEPSVAVQLDDVPVSFQAQAFSDLTDQYGNFGSQTATELQPAHDFHRYAGVRRSVSY